MFKPIPICYFGVWSEFKLYIFSIYNIPSKIVLIFTLNAYKISLNLCGSTNDVLSHVLCRNFRWVMVKKVVGRPEIVRLAGDYDAVMKNLTLKQREVFHYVSEGRSTKEISANLGISDSAVNQRIEAVRARAGGVSRAELARAYRAYFGNVDNTISNVPLKEGAPSGECGVEVCKNRDVCPDFVRGELFSESVDNVDVIPELIASRFVNIYDLLRWPINMAVIIMALLLANMLGFCVGNSFSELV